MNDCREIFELCWTQTKGILSEMSKLYKQMKEGTADDGVQKRYSARVILLDKHTQSLFNTLASLDDQEKIDHLSLLASDFRGSFYDDLGDGKALCRDIVERMFTVANFQVLQRDGDQERWKSLRDRYEELLRDIPKQ